MGQFAPLDAETLIPDSNDQEFDTRHHFAPCCIAVNPT